MAEDEKLESITDSMDEFEQTLGESVGQGRLKCCSSWHHKESDMTQPLKKMHIYIINIIYIYIYLRGRGNTCSQAYLLVKD